ncbi:hypothetical protein WJX81_000264, partial [Elliptochloris bilobata]
MLEDGLVTATSLDQVALEQRITALYADLGQAGAPAADLLRRQHVQYLHSGLGTLPNGFVALDAGRPWICYWIVHALALLDAPFPPDVMPADVAQFLGLCQCPGGGFGGGPGQLAHLAPTYAAVAALAELGGAAALGIVDRAATARFLTTRCVPPEHGGGFSLCEGGEVDVRGCYTALVVAHMLDLDIPALVARSGLIDYVCRCQ